MNDSSLTIDSIDCRGGVTVVEVGLDDALNDCCVWDGGGLGSSDSGLTSNPSDILVLERLPWAGLIFISSPR